MNDFNKLYVAYDELHESIDIRLTNEILDLACNTYCYVFDRVARLQQHEKIKNCEELKNYQLWRIESNEKRSDQLRLSCYAKDSIAYSETIKYFIYPLPEHFELWRVSPADENSYLVIGLLGQFLAYFLPESGIEL